MHAIALIQGWHLLSSTSITSRHYLRAAIIIGVLLIEVNTVINLLKQMNAEA